MYNDLTRCKTIYTLVSLENVGGCQPLLPPRADDRLVLYSILYVFIVVNYGMSEISP